MCRIAVRQDPDASRQAQEQNAQVNRIEPHLKNVFHLIVSLNCHPEPPSFSGEGSPNWPDARSFTPHSTLRSEPALTEEGMTDFLRGRKTLEVHQISCADLTFPKSDPPSPTPGDRAGD
jgi:hypothetical protein